MLIGKRITIKEAKNKSLQGISGKVVDETKNTLVIAITNGGDRKTSKQSGKKTITIIKEQTITIEETQ